MDRYRSNLKVSPNEQFLLYPKTKYRIEFSTSKPTHIPNLESFWETLHFDQRGAPTADSQTSKYDKSTNLQDIQIPTSAYVIGHKDLYVRRISRESDKLYETAQNGELNGSLTRQIPKV